MSVVTATALRGFPHFVVIGITNNGCFIITFLNGTFFSLKLEISIFSKIQNHVLNILF